MDPNQLVEVIIEDGRVPCEQQEKHEEVELPPTPDSSPLPHEEENIEIEQIENSQCTVFVTSSLTPPLTPALPPLLRPGIVQGRWLWCPPRTLLGCCCGDSEDDEDDVTTLIGSSSTASQRLPDERTPLVGNGERSLSWWRRLCCWATEPQEVEDSDGAAMPNDDSSEWLFQRPPPSAPIDIIYRRPTFP